MPTNHRMSARLSAGTRHYFFDLGQSSTGYVLSITENKPTASGFERQRVTVHEQYFEVFLDQVLQLMPRGKRFGRSYQPWTKNEDELLRAGVRANRSLEEMAKIHERATGAIRSRIEKLGLG